VVVTGSPGAVAAYHHRRRRLFAVSIVVGVFGLSWFFMQALLILSLYYPASFGSWGPAIALGFGGLLIVAQGSIVNVANRWRTAHMLATASGMTALAVVGGAAQVVTLGISATVSGDDALWGMAILDASLAVAVTVNGIAVRRSVLRALGEGVVLS